MAASKRQAIARLISIVAVGLLAAGAVYMFRSPLSISEREARDLVKSHELIGLPLEDAGKRLQHRVPDTQDGLVILEFRQVKGWKAGPLTLDVRNGKVAAATWGDGSQGEE
jgi:hypothetical protein